MKTIYIIKRATVGLTLAVLTTLMSCQKEKKEDTCRVSIGSLSGIYKIVSLKYKLTAGSPEEDYMVFFDPCERDDQVRLNSNKTYDYIDAGTSCNPPGSDQGTWDLIGNKVDSDGLIQGEIQSFDCSTLIIYLPDLYSEGDRLTFTFQKL